MRVYTEYWKQKRGRGEWTIIRRAWVIPFLALIRGGVVQGPGSLEGKERETEEKKTRVRSQLLTKKTSWKKTPYP